MIAVSAPGQDPDRSLLSPQMITLLVRLGNLTTRLEKVVDRLDKDEHLDRPRHKRPPEVSP